MIYNNLDLILGGIRMKKFRTMLLVLIGVSFLVSGFQITRRVIKEQRNKNVEIVADLEDFKNLAIEMNMPIEDMAKKLIGAGTTSIAISEETLTDMANDGRILMYPAVSLKHIDVNFNNEYRNLASNMREYIEENNLEYSTNTIVLTDSKEEYDFLINSFKNRFSGITTEFNSENKFGILIGRKQDKVKNVGLGLIDEDFEYAKSLGFNNIIPRIENHEGITTDEVDELYEQLKRYKVRTIVFAGVTVYGQSSQDENEEMLKYIGDKFSKEGAEIITAIIEKPVETDLETVQRGIKTLSKASKYINTKVYSIDASGLSRITASNMVEQWGRAISQRNVRVLYVRPLSLASKTPSENFDDTISAIREIKSRVNYMGMKVDSAKGLGNIKQNNFIQCFMAIGIVSAGFLLLILLLDLTKFSKAVYGLFILSVLATIGLYCVSPIYAVLGGIANKGFSFMASIIFPSISGLYLIYVYNKESKVEEKKVGNIIVKSIVMLLGSVLIAGVGGVFIGALLSGSEYVLKLDVFRGVKLSFILPLLIFAFAYVVKCGIYTDEDGKPLNIWEQAKKLLDSSITVKYALAGAILIVGLLVVVMRSGNTLVSSASSIELAIRNFLEKYLVARPRTKELIAFPVLMFIVYSARYKVKELGLLIMLVGMIGIENVVNSFCHIRMPVMVTLLSSIYSLIFAVVIGSIGIVIIEKIINLVKKQKGGSL